MPPAGDAVVLSVAVDLDLANPPSTCCDRAHRDPTRRTESDCPPPSVICAISMSLIMWIGCATDSDSMKMCVRWLRR